MLLDDLIPADDFRETHATWVRAPPERVYAALKQVTPAEVPLFRVLMAVRGLPARLAGPPRRGFDGRRPLYDQVLAAGFTRLAEAPNRELVVGRVAQLWALAGGAAAAVDGRDQFVAFATPGYAKAALSFTVAREGGGTRLRTETRIRATDAAARRKFARCWFVIRPASAAIRLAWLRAIRRRAERQHGSLNG